MNIISERAFFGYGSQIFGFNYYTRKNYCLFKGKCNECRYRLYTCRQQSIFIQKQPKDTGDSAKKLDDAWKSLDACEEPWKESELARQVIQHALQLISQQDYSRSNSSRSYSQTNGDNLNTSNILYRLGVGYMKLCKWGKATKIFQECDSQMKDRLELKLSYADALKMHEEKSKASEIYTSIIHLLELSPELYADTSQNMNLQNKLLKKKEVISQMESKPYSDHMRGYKVTNSMVNSLPKNLVNFIICSTSNRQKNKIPILWEITNMTVSYPFFILAEVLASRAWCYYEIGKLDLAMQDWIRITKLNRGKNHQCSYSWAYLGRLASLHGKWQQTIEFCDKALKINPTNLYALEERRTAFFVLKKKNEAKKDLQTFAILLYDKLFNILN